MIKEKILLTKEGFENLKKEYKDLIEVTRPHVIAELKRSRELGDLSENGAYHAAREKQSFIEGRIKELEAILKNVEVAKASSKSIASLGSFVTLQQDKKDGTIPKAKVTASYTIVGSGESDLSLNKIAYDSPLGNAIVGKKKGDKVIVTAPSGVIEYTIVNVE